MVGDAQKYIRITLFVLLVGLSLWILLPLFFAIFVGALLAYMTYPLYQRITSHFTHKSIPAFLVCLAVLVIIVLPLVFFVHVLVQESYTMYILTKERLSSGLFANCETFLCPMKEIIEAYPFLNTQVQEGLQFVTNWIIQKGTGFLLSLPRLLLNVMVVVFSLFYFLRDGDLILARINSFIGMQHKRYELLKTRLKEILRALMFGYFTIALLQGVLGAVGFWVVGLPSPLFWGLLMTFLALIPYLGTGLIWGPAAIILFIDGILTDSTALMMKGIGLFLYGLIVVSSVDNILRPKLISDRAKIHPLTILVGILGGIILFGAIGILIGPLILSLTTVILDQFVDEKTA